MSLRLTLEVGGQPRGKANHTTRGGISYLSGATRDYLAKLQYAAQQEMAGREPTKQPVRLKVYATFGVAKSWAKKKRDAALLGHTRPCTKPDCDNILKIVGDAGNGVIWHDDEQIVDSHITKRYGAVAGLVVHIETIGPAEVAASDAAPLTRVAAAPGDLFAVPP